MRVSDDPPTGVPSSAQAPEPVWFAVRTRARAEKKVAGRVRDLGFEVYLPLVQRERQWADRKKLVRFALFPGYVFVRFILADMGQVLRDPGVVTVVRSAGKAVAIRSEELEAVRRLEAGIEQTGLEPHAADFLAPGDPVRVVAGPFEGMAAVLLEERGDVRVCVRLTAIRQAVCVELSRTVLVPFK